nr:isoform 2 of e3 ubiquitin-protein ligase [Quercus suber]POF00911.1 isoform 2 of e3 ubiquitin-protein ligase [Quercus suber]
MDLVPSLPLPKMNPMWKGKADFFRPFRNAAAEAREGIQHLYDPDVHQASEDPANLRDLNTALLTLLEIFPDVEPEVFRDMLVNVSDESRVQVVTEQMLRHKNDTRRSKATQLRWNSAESKQLRSATDEAKFPGSQTGMLLEDTFRTNEYQTSVKQVLYAEFRNMNHSQIKAVMLEMNYSYTLARPILQQLSAKTWRLPLPNFWSKRNRQATVGLDHPYLHWTVSPIIDGAAVPAVKRTGSVQLDRELYDLFVEPHCSRQKQEILAIDHALASRVNEEAAEQTGALFDCECCYSSVPFEQLATCDQECHQLCFDCVRRTVKEALYGQGWARAADLEKATIRCFSPIAPDCHGCVVSDILQRILAQGTENHDLWHEFQARISRETLLKCKLSLQRCPSCDYAEVAETPSPRFRSFRRIWHHVNNESAAALQIMTVSLVAGLTMFTIPLIIVVSICWLLAKMVPAIAALIAASWSRVYNHRRGPRFTCRHPSCGRTSCIRCNAIWRDPHTCFENEKTSLRTAIESSATAAVKRTCPKCHLSFVKSSGCNKLVCNCGYTMCYICRQEITSNVGYAHFCQHFRPTGGRCGECERCDLYGDEDEAMAIRKAAELAEKAWRDNESTKGMNNDSGTAQLMVEALVGTKRPMRRWEGWLDMFIDALFE